MPENSMSRTQVFKPRTIAPDDPQAQLMLEAVQHLTDVIRTEKEDGLDRQSEAEDSMATSISTAGRHYALKVAGAAIALVSTIATGFYQYAGPAEQAKKADAAVEHVDEKMVQLEATQEELETLKTGIEEERQARVNGRLSGVENRMATVEGQQVGTDSKVDSLLDATLTKNDAKEAKAQASVKAAAAETNAVQKMKADAKAEGDG